MSLSAQLCVQRRVRSMLTRCCWCPENRFSVLTISRKLQPGFHLASTCDSAWGLPPATRACSVYTRGRLERYSRELMFLSSSHPRAAFTQCLKGSVYQYPGSGAFLVAQRSRIHLPMQEKWVLSLIGEDPTCRRAAKPVYHHYWACALEPVFHNEKLP